MSNYPEPNDEDFQLKIYKKREFYYHTIPKREKFKTYEEIDKYRNDIKGELSMANEKLNKLKSDYEVLEKEKENSEEKCTKLKQLLVKAKKDVSDAKQQEAEHMSKDASIRGQLEKCNLEIENYKVSPKN